MSDWAWAYPTYSFTIVNNSDIQQIIIDPDQKVADINLKNNRLSKEKVKKLKGKKQIQLLFEEGASINDFPLRIIYLESKTLGLGFLLESGTLS